MPRGAVRAPRASVVPGELSRRSRWLARPRSAAARRRQGIPPPIPPAAPPSRRGGLVGGSIQAVGRVTGSLLRLLTKTTHPPTPSLKGRGRAHPPPARGRERGVQAEGGSGTAKTRCLARRLLLTKEHIMAFVRVEQRNARLAAPVRLDTVQGRDGPLARGTRRRDLQRPQGLRRAARGGGHVDPVDPVGQAGRERGRVPRQGQPGQRRRPGAEQQLPERRRRPVYGLVFTCEEIDYLDSRAGSRGARAREAMPPRRPAATSGPEPTRERPKRPTPKLSAATDDDVPF